MNLFDSLKLPLLAKYPQLVPEDIPLTTPPNLALGDLAIPMFLAAKKCQMAPAKLAAEAAAGVAWGDAVVAAVATGPYLNLKLDRGAFASTLVANILAAGNRFGSSGSGAGKRVLLEHTSINPNASPHVGRARNAMLGDSLARLFRFENYDTEVHYYVNDMGRQIGLLVLVADELQSMTFDEVLGAYVRANERAKTELEFAERGYELLAKMEIGDPPTQQKFRAVTDLCLNGQLEVLARLGATYDCFDRESKYVRDPRLDPLLDALRQRDALFTDDQERLVVDLAKLGHPQEEGRYFVLMRANGSSLYGYRDLAYSFDKEALDADLNLIVLGEDHKLYAQQVAMILEAAGHRAPEPIYYAYILLKEGKMSTRQGKVVLLSDFLDRATALAKERVAEQCHDLTPQEQETIAKQVAVAAIRFTVLRVSANKNVTFDMEDALSFQGDTGPYIQYSCARIRSILRKYDGPLAAEPAANFPLENDAEWALVLKLCTFEGIIADCVAGRNIAPIAVFALETARLFTTFYHDCPVLAAGTPALVEARAQLCQATLQTLTNALHLLGIQAPERM